MNWNIVINLVKCGSTVSFERGHFVYECAILKNEIIFNALLFSFVVIFFHYALPIQHLRHMLLTSMSMLIPLFLLFIFLKKKLHVEFITNYLH